jgi:3-hydroxybutyryl-CoA dehydrogenase
MRESMEERWERFGDPKTDRGMMAEQAREDGTPGTTSSGPDRIAVVGAGQMGNGIAHVFAAGGHTVTMIDVSADALARGRSTIEKNLERQTKKGSMTVEDAHGALSRIETATSLDGAASANVVVEAATERTDLKFKIFEELDRIAPQGAILASNTSSISITEIAARTKRPERVIGMHFMNPVPVMALVEVIRGLATSTDTTERVMSLAKALGKTPVDVNDYPGFVANRILMPMINEAVYCVMEGVGTPEAVDTVMKLGMNHPMGPLALADFIGLDTCLAILEVLHEGLGDSKYRPAPLLRKYVAAGWLGKKSGRGFYAY